MHFRHNQWKTRSVDGGWEKTFSYSPYRHWMIFFVTAPYQTMKQRGCLHLVSCSYIFIHRRLGFYQILYKINLVPVIDVI